MRWWWLAVVLVTSAVPVAAQDRIVLGEVLASWQGDDTVQFVELQLLADGQQTTMNRAELVFDDATADLDHERVFTLTANLVRGTAGAKVLIASARLSQLVNIVPDFVLPEAYIHPRGGRVCLRVLDAQNAVRIVDCLAWGDFSGSTGGFGVPSRATPENRSLVRVALNGVIRRDWQGALEPTPERNDGAAFTMATLCGDGAISQGEECDGDALAGATCASLGFAKGTLSCTQCHYDTSKCTFCGNRALNDREECDGNDFGEATCESIGFTGGTLTCTPGCKVDTATCDDTFFLPGGGPAKPDCQLEWRVRHAGAKPGVSGKVPPRLKCRDGDPACDAGDTPGSCTLPVSVCLARTDARLAKCLPEATASWTLTLPADGPAATDLTAAVAALGGTAAGGQVTFTPALSADGRCSDPVDLVVPARTKLRLKATATAADGKPRDGDALKIVCTP